MAAGATAAAARRLRRLSDMEAVGFAAAALLLDCPHPDVLAIARPQITQGTRAVTTALGAPLTVPEHAEACYARGWGRRCGHCSGLTTSRPPTAITTTGRDTLTAMRTLLRMLRATPTLHVHLPEDHHSDPRLVS